MEFQKAKDWSWLHEAKWVLCGLDRQSKFAFNNGGLLECGPLLPIRALFEIGSNGNKVHDLQKTLYYDILQSAEDQVPGSSVYLSDFLKNPVASITGAPEKMSFSKYLEFIKPLIRNDLVKRIVDQFYDLLSGDSRIVLKRGQARGTILETRENIRLPIDVDPIFSRITGEHGVALDYCKVLAIEGSIANVSEVHGLLERFSESMVPCLLVCQNFSEEVSNTLAVNWLKKKLLVIPVRYGNSLSNINFLSDLAAASGALPISKNLGDSISSACLDEERYGNLSRIKVYETHCLAEPSINPIAHIAELMNRMKKEEVEDKVEIISERISNLSSNILEITVFEEDINAYEELDACIKILNEFIKYGASVHNGKTMPYSIYRNCVERSSDMKNRISSTGGFLYQQ